MNNPQEVENKYQQLREEGKEITEAKNELTKEFAVSIIASWEVWRKGLDTTQNNTV